MTRYLPYEAPLHAPARPSEGRMPERGAHRPDSSRRAREAAAALLRAVGASLEGLALRLVQAQRAAEEAAPAHEPVFEFYADAGAPEGALYIDGQRVGTLVGVTRL